MGKEGHRVNAISAGPIKTLAASGVKNFRKMLSYNANRAPLRRNVSTEEVGNAATFLASDLASGITGETLYVDAGFNITAMGSLEDPSYRLQKKIPAYLSAKLVTQFQLFPQEKNFLKNLFLLPKLQCLTV